MKKIIQRLLCFLLILSLLPATLFVSAKGGFRDVSSTAWYATAISFVSDTGKMEGVGLGRFEPETRVSRAMLATVLYRLDGGSVTYTTSTFKDNKKGKWYFNGIEYCARKGIVQGYGNGKFGVNDLLSRQDMMTMFYRYAEYHSLVEGKIKNVLSTYKDAGAVSRYALNAVNWCLQEGVVNGTSNTMVSPMSTATRAQLAQILFNYAECVLQEDVRRYHKSADNPYGIGVTGVRLYNDKLTFRLTGLEDNGALELVVRYRRGNKTSAEDRLTIAYDAYYCYYEGDASTLSFVSAMDAGLYKKGSAQLSLYENGKLIFSHTLSFGNILQKSPDGVKLYFKGEKTLDSRILLYHEFVEFEPLPESYGSVSTPARFEENILHIMNRGYSIIPLQFLFDYNEGKRALPEKSVILTFDDGYESNFTMIYPILKKYNVPATIFVIVSSMDQPLKLKWDQMREMEQSGLVDIQNHSLYHHNHTTLNSKELHHYFSTSFATLEGQLGAEKNRILAYPYGRYTDLSIDIAKQYDVRMQVTTEWRALNMENLQFHKLPRINVGYASDIDMLLSVTK